jgi:hypothetical protein
MQGAVKLPGCKRNLLRMVAGDEVAVADKYSTATRWACAGPESGLAVSSPTSNGEHGTSLDFHHTRAFCLLGPKWPESSCRPPDIVITLIGSVSATRIEATKEHSSRAAGRLLHTYDLFCANNCIHLLVVGGTK